MAALPIITVPPLPAGHPLRDFAAALERDDRRAADYHWIGIAPRLRESVLIENPDLAALGFEAR